MNKLLYSVKESCQAIGISANRFYDALNAGEIKAKKLGGRTMVAADEIKRFVDAIPDLDAARPSHNAAGRPKGIKNRAKVAA